jgi:hypothetical protein
MATAEDVRRAVAASFPEAERPVVRAALRGYKFGREAARVRLAILALADGNLAEVERLVAAANADYRDVLYWAEYPEESGTGTKPQMAARYRRLGVAVPPDLA